MVVDQLLQGRVVLALLAMSFATRALLLHFKLT